MTQPSTRERIVSAADELFYEAGYDHTSFATIAEAVGLSRGNFYHHFKSKDEILVAVIQRRTANTQAMLNDWTASAASPRERLVRFADLMVMNSAAIRRHGCPVGTLCSELAKLEHPALPQASSLFQLFRQWLTKQLIALDFSPGQADRHAMHLLARSQGIAVMANAFDDNDFILQEVAQLHRWIHDLRPSGAQQP
jgi:TetR/AcrR family transcriptional regulator, transcriptional repressor for nem operon